jgi:GAF domain-containing protein
MDIAEGRSLRSFLYLPLVYENKVIGVLITGNREPIRLPEHIIESCVSLVNISSLTISNARLFQDTRQKLLDLQK